MIKEEKLWVDVIKGNCIPSNGMAIEFVAPKILEGEIEINIKVIDVESEVKFWESSLIMYVLGKDLSMNVVKHFMFHFWDFI